MDGAPASAGEKGNAVTKGENTVDAEVTAETDQTDGLNDFDAETEGDVTFGDVDFNQ